MLARLTLARSAKGIGVTKARGCNRELCIRALIAAAKRHLLTGAIFKRTKLPLTTGFVTTYTISHSQITGASTMELMRQLDAIYNTPWMLK